MLAGTVINIAVVIPVIVLREAPTISEKTMLFPTAFIKWRGGFSSKIKVYRTTVIMATRLLPAIVAFIANMYLIVILLHRRPRRAFANRMRRNGRSRLDDFGTTWALILISVFLLLSLVPSAIVQLLAIMFPNIYLNKNCVQYRYYTTTLAFGRLEVLSHLPRFDHDWYRGVNRGPIGTIVSNLIRSYHILMSIVIIGIIVENFWLPKIFPRLPRLPRLAGPSWPSHQIVCHRNKSQ